MTFDGNFCEIMLVTTHVATAIMTTESGQPSGTPVLLRIGEDQV